MSKPIVHMALFEEEALIEVGEALDVLRGMGIPEGDISVISGVPFSEKMLGRPMSWTRVPLIAGVGAVVGFLTAAFFNFGTPALYPVRTPPRCSYLRSIPSGPRPSDNRSSKRCSSRSRNCPPQPWCLTSREKPR